MNSYKARLQHNKRIVKINQAVKPWMAWPGPGGWIRAGKSAPFHETPGDCHLFCLSAEGFIYLIIIRNFREITGLDNTGLIKKQGYGSRT